MRRFTIAAIPILASLAAAACGGAQVPDEGPAVDPKADSEKAIATIRASFDAMGGIERLRLAGAKVKITAVASAAGRDEPVEITLGGPAKFRMDYIKDEITYAYLDGACRKTVYGVSARCTPQEAQWVEPMKILVGLTFPANDAAQLGASFRTREDVTAGGRSCSVVEARPKNTNLKIRAAYDKATGLLVQAAFDLKDAAGAKTHWVVSYGDWRTVKKMQASHARSVTVDGREIWREAASAVDFDAFDERAFDPPLPPCQRAPVPACLPPRSLRYSPPASPPLPPALPDRHPGRAGLHRPGGPALPAPGRAGA